MGCAGLDTEYRKGLRCMASVARRILLRVGCDNYRRELIGRWELACSELACRVEKKILIASNICRSHLAFADVECQMSVVGVVGG